MKSRPPSPHKGAIIATLTDFGADSVYVGSMKAAALAASPGAVVVDISHGVRPQSIEEASFLLALVFEFFPEGTVFLVVVDPGVGGSRRNMIFESRSRLVVAPDNGLVSDIGHRFGIDGSYSIRAAAVEKIRGHRACGRTFMGRDVFAPVAAVLAAGEPVRRLGARVRDFELIALPNLDVKDDIIKGTGRHVDRFGNILTNVTGADLKKAFGDRPLGGIRACIAGTTEVSGVSEFFSQVGEGGLAVILNSWDHIEISVNGGRAVDRFPAGRNTAIELTVSTGG